MLNFRMLFPAAIGPLLVTVIVYVRIPPGRTVFGATETATARSVWVGAGGTFADAVATLLLLSGSSVSAVTVPIALSTVVLGAWSSRRTTNEKTAVVPLSMRPIVADTSPIS